MEVLLIMLAVFLLCGAVAGAGWHAGGHRSQRPSARAITVGNQLARDYAQGFATGLRAGETDAGLFQRLATETRGLARVWRDLEQEDLAAYCDDLAVRYQVVCEMYQAVAEAERAERKDPDAAVGAPAAAPDLGRDLFTALPEQHMSVTLAGAPPVAGVSRPVTPLPVAEPRYVYLRPGDAIEGSGFGTRRVFLSGADPEDDDEPTPAWWLPDDAQARRGRQDLAAANTLLADQLRAEEAAVNPPSSSYVPPRPCIAWDR